VCQILVPHRLHISQSLTIVGSITESLWQQSVASLDTIYACSWDFAPSVFRRLGKYIFKQGKFFLGQNLYYPVTAVRLKVEENQLVDVFGEICVRVDGLKSA